MKKIKEWIIKKLDRIVSLYDSFRYKMRKYKYYKNLKMREFSEQDIDYTNNQIRKLAIKEFLNKEFDISENVCRIFLIWIVGLVVLLVTRDFSHFIAQIKALFTNFVRVVLDNDGLSNFLGSLLGSVVTLLGVFITIKFENKNQKKILKANVRPILRLSGVQSDYESNQKPYKTIFYPRMGNEEYMLKFPDFVLRNIGHTALNVKVYLSFNGYGYCCSNIIDCIPSGTDRIIKSEINVSKHDMEGIIDHVLKKSEVKISEDKIDRTMYDKNIHISGKCLIGWDEIMEVKYQDVYGNEYTKWYKLIIYSFEDNGTYKFYVDFTYRK